MMVHKCHLRLDYTVNIDEHASKTVNRTSDLVGGLDASSITVYSPLFLSIIYYADAPSHLHDCQLTCRAVRKIS